MARIVTVGTAPTLLAAAKAVNLRGNLLFQVVEGGKTVWVARSDVAVGVGFKLLPNADAPCTMLVENDPLSKPAASAWYAVVATGTQDVIVEEGT